MRARLEVGLKLKKTLREIDSIPWSELMLWIALLEIHSDEHEKRMAKARNGRR